MRNNWSKYQENRLNPRNGLCLNSIHDKAFDKRFIAITPDYKVETSKYFNDFETDKSVKGFFLNFNYQSTNLPDKFLPSKEFLDYYKNNIFIN